MLIHQYSLVFPSFLSIPQYSLVIVVVRILAISGFFFVRSRAPSRIRTFPKTWVGSFRLIKNLGLELEPNSFEKHEHAFFGRYRFWDFRRDIFAVFLFFFVDIFLSDDFHGFQMRK